MVIKNCQRILVFLLFGAAGNFEREEYTDSDEYGTYDYPSNNLVEVGEQRFPQEK